MINAVTRHGSIRRDVIIATPPFYTMTSASSRFAILLLLLMLIAGTACFAQNRVQQKLPERTRILFLLDGSGSMNGVWEGDKSRMEAAKEILTRLVDSLRVNPNLELALRVYGHRYPRQSNNCQDTRLEVPFAARNHDAIINKLSDIKPKGVTPITYSMEQAAGDFPATAGYRNILILITDGIESCGGDPCAASIALQRRGVFLRPFIIGLGLEGGKVLDCAGQYFDSHNSNTFNQVLNKSIKTTFATTTVSVELLDGNNQPRESNVTVSFLNNMTGNAAYEFVHYLDSRGRPDSVQLDPVLSYDVVVNTVPQIIRRNVNITNGEHNVIRIPAAQGSLRVDQQGRNAPFPIVVRQKGQTEILNTQQAKENFKYLTGSYEIETLTLPRRKFDVKIEAGELKSITLPTPGLVNINTLTPGYGSIFEITSDGTERWVCHLNDDRSRQAFTLLPGRYKIAFRARAAGGSKYTAVKTFDLQSGQTLGVNVFD